MKKYLILLAVSLLLICSCATTKNTAECPETIDMMCLTGRECALDRERDCMICHCAEPGHGNLARDIENRHGEAPVHGPADPVAP